MTEKANFGQFLAKMGKTEFFQKALGTFLSRLQALTNCKVSEKVMNGFEKLRHGQTNGRTDGRTWFLRSQTTTSRDQKEGLLSRKYLFSLIFQLPSPCILYFMSLRGYVFCMILPSFLVNTYYMNQRMGVMVFVFKSSRYIHVFTQAILFFITHRNYLHYLLVIFRFKHQNVV